jgi:N-acetylmuramoyl-L-alanine amidase
VALINPIPGTDQSNNSGYPADSGLDIAVDVGTLCVAAADGVVEYAESEYSANDVRQDGDTNPSKPGYQVPWTVRIRLKAPIKHEGTTYKWIWYTHLTSVDDAIRNKSEVPIKAGDPVGRTGYANGLAHLHFGILADRAQTITMSYQDVADLIWSRAMRDNSLLLLSAVAGIYKVMSGDTLYQIAQKNGLTIQDILDANPSIKNPNYIQVGDLIAIPSAGNANDNSPTVDPEDADIMARTIMGEARGEPEEGQIAVAWVILNRAASGKWYGGGGDIYSVCRKPYQFSCWNSDDPNRSIIIRARAGDPVFDKCLAVAKMALRGSVSDPTNNATHYYAKYIAAPAWSRPPAIFTVRIGVHKFYKNVA